MRSWSAAHRRRGEETNVDKPSDVDPIETREWLEALEGVLEVEGEERLHFLLEQLLGEARAKGARVPYSATTAYLNTLAPDREVHHPGDRAIEHRIRSFIRWNALAIVLRANKESSELGGHIASFQSAATLYDTGFMHFWHGATESHGGDLIYIQGHCSPGIYARAFVEGRLSEQQLDRFRQEVDGPGSQLLPASLADARLLAVPDRLDGPRPDHGHLPGAIPEIPARSRAGRDRDRARSGRSWATARPTSPRAWAPSRWPAARSSTT